MGVMVLWQRNTQGEQVSLGKWDVAQGHVGTVLGHWFACRVEQFYKFMGDDIL